MSIGLISNGESGLSTRTKLNDAITQLNAGTFDTVSATNNGNGTNFAVGDDTWIGDVNIANTMQIKGQQNAAKAFIKFSSGSNSSFIGGTNNGYFQVTGSMFISGTYNQSNINIVDYNQKGGAGYTGFLTVTNTAPGATTPSKFFRLNSIGSLQIVDSAYQNTIFELTDSGSVTIRGGLSTSGSNTFIGTQTVTGSLITSGSNTLIGNTVLSGSINISGSQTFNGTSAFYGNHTLSGSNTITGNTTMSGSIEVSGSSNFRNSSFTVTGSTFIKGVTQISGSTSITGSFNVVDGNINIVSGSAFTRWGNKLFNYGAFSDTTTQTTSQNTATAMKLNTTDIGGLGVNIVSQTRIQVDNTGIYNLQFSAQLDRVAGSGNATNVVTIWLNYTGSSVSSSAGDVTVTGAATTSATIAAWNYVLPIQANDYVEIMWSTPSTDVGIRATGSRATPARPAVPSVIATLTQVA